MEMSDHLTAARFVDSDDPAVRASAAEVVGAERHPAARSVRLFEAVRDGIRHAPSFSSTDPTGYRASAALAAGRSWCVLEAVLPAAAAQAAGIPARLGFADVRNRLRTPPPKERMNGVDTFLLHGHADLHLDGRWFRATPVIGAEMCGRVGAAPTAFDGRSDALLHAYTADGGPCMDHVHVRGVDTDLPLDELVQVRHEVCGGTLDVGTAPGELDGFTPTPVRP